MLRFVRAGVFLVPVWIMPEPGFHAALFLVLGTGVVVCLFAFMLRLIREGRSFRKPEGGGRN